MNRHPSPLNVVPLVHGTVASLRDAGAQLGKVDARELPEDPLVRAALSAGVSHSLDCLEQLTASLRDLRAKLS